MHLFAYKRLPLAAIVAFGFALSAGSRLVAQTVRGVVTDSVLGGPVAGAVVTLLDSAGRLASQTITGAKGTYALPVVGQVRRVRVIRIGYRPSSRALTIAFPSADTTVNVGLSALPTMLDPVAVTDAGHCEPRADRAAAFALWEQARAGLLATVVGRAANPARVSAIFFHRYMKNDGHTIALQTLRHAALASSRPFITARPVRELEKFGYVSDDSNGRTYFGPDADALLDPTFASTHCFSLAADARHHPNALGLAFEPAIGDSLPNIKGTLWVDTNRPELLSLDFRYVRVGADAERVSSGGSMTFHTASNGIAMIDRWSIRSPGSVRSELVVSGFTGSRVQTTIQVDEVGAQIQRAEWPDGTVWRNPEQSVHGRVVARADDRQPVANALVWLADTDDSTRTAADGSFVIDDLLPGPYTLRVADSVAAHSHFQMNDDLEVHVDSGRVETVRVRLPSLSAVIARACAYQPRGEGPILILGVVQFSDRTPAPGEQVEVSWTPKPPPGQMDKRSSDDGTPPPRVFRRQTRADGTFEVCGVDGNVPVTLRLLGKSANATFPVTRTFGLAPSVERVVLTVPSPSTSGHDRPIGAFDRGTPRR